MKTINLVYPGFLSTFNRSDEEDPLKAFRFHVEIQGFARFGFSKVTGLRATTAVIPYREGGDNTTEKKSPGLTTFPNVTLERGQIFASGYGDKDVLNWYVQVFNSSAKGPSSSNRYRRTVDVVQFDKEAVERYRWRLANCWPTEHSPMGDLDALGNNNNIEQMVLAHEGYRLIPNAGQ